MSHRYLKACSSLSNYQALRSNLYLFLFLHLIFVSSCVLQLLAALKISAVMSGISFLTLLLIITTSTWYPAQLCVPHNHVHEWKTPVSHQNPWIKRPHNLNVKPGWSINCDFTHKQDYLRMNAFKNVRECFCAQLKYHPWFLVSQWKIPLYFISANDTWAKSQV